jgi:hypothetical protein
MAKNRNGALTPRHFSCPQKRQRDSFRAGCANIPINREFFEKCFYGAGEIA